MFSSLSKRSYQQIDDDYDDEVLRNSTCTSRFMQGFGSSTRSILFGNENRGEHMSLIASSSSQHSYHDSPSDPPTHDPQYEQFTVQGPPTMASSTQLGSRRWDHIGNLDEFFTHIYEYHQNGGYLCIVLQKVFSLLQFAFIMSFTTFFTQCVNYSFLFANSNVTSHGDVNQGKRHFSDAVVENCPSHLSIWMIFAIVAAVVYWITRVIKHAQYLLKMTDIQHFYQNELKITDDQLPNLTWHAIVKRICEAQKKLRLSIHTDNITSIYIYHRILRYRNYIISMINKRVLNPVFSVPFLGTIAYLPNNLKHEIERILFTSSTAAWANGPNLSEEYKNHEMLEMASKKMADDCKFYGFLSLILMPLILPFQIMESFFSLTELIKRRPDGLGMRRYSNYGRYLVRHFNELDHELSARLNRSHIYAAAYMDQFFSPVLIIIAKNVTFVAAAVVVTLTGLAAWDEDVLQVEHVLTVITVCGVIILACRGAIPDENLVWQPEILMTHVASELHYLPSEWKGKAHTPSVRHQFDQLFQMKWMFFVLEITSPIFTPFMLLFWLRPKCAKLTEFFHDYTERIDGLGDVCSFAQMDVGKHGDPKWNRWNNAWTAPEEQGNSESTVTPHNRARDGKTELSILHFKTTNPEWQPPKSSEQFLRKFRSRLGQDASQLAPIGLPTLRERSEPREIRSELRDHRNCREQRTERQDHRNILMESVHSILPTATSAKTAPGRHPLIGEGLHRIDGPLESAFQGVQSRIQGVNGGVLASLYQEQPGVAESLTNSLRASGVDIDGAGAEMRINALFLRGLHDESVIASTRNYGSSSINMHPTAMQSVFAMPDGFGNLMDMESPTYQRENVQRSVAGPSQLNQSTFNRPEPLAELGDLPIASAPSSSGATTSTAPLAPFGQLIDHQARSRLVINEENEEDEDEEEEDNTPPHSFSS